MGSLPALRKDLYPETRLQETTEVALHLINLTAKRKPQQSEEGNSGSFRQRSPSIWGGFGVPGALLDPEAAFSHRL